MKETSNDSPPSLVTLISGYRGLAETLIERFSARGHRLSVLVRKAEEIPTLARKFPRAHFFAGDLADTMAPSLWIREALQKFGRIDVVVNNAAVQGPGGRFHELKWDEIEETLSINLSAALKICQAAIPIFLEQKAGTIVNLSGGGATQARPRFLPYAISKVALVRATETLAEEYPELGFYAVSPGTLKTQMTQAILDLGSEKAGAEFAPLEKKLAAGGDGTERAAQLILWLAEEQPRHLSGKLVSAIWDEYRHGNELPKNFWTLRRVDQALIDSLGKTPK